MWASAGYSQSTVMERVNVASLLLCCCCLGAASANQIYQTDVLERIAQETKEMNPTIEAPPQLGLPDIEDNMVQQDIVERLVPAAQTESTRTSAAVHLLEQQTDQQSSSQSNSESSPENTSEDTSENTSEEMSSEESNTQLQEQVGDTRDNSLSSEENTRKMGHILQLNMLREQINQTADAVGQADLLSNETQEVLSVETNAVADCPEGQQDCESKEAILETADDLNYRLSSLPVPDDEHGGLPVP